MREIVAGYNREDYLGVILYNTQCRLITVELLGAHIAYAGGQ